MPKTPQISGAEWKVMRALWKKAPQPSSGLIQELGRTEGWHQNTVKTLLARLLKKKAVAAKKNNNLFLYSPKVTEEECIQKESESFLDRFFGGAVQPLLVHFARKRMLSKKDLEDLRKILEGKR